MQNFKVVTLFTNLSTEKWRGGGKTVKEAHFTSG